MSQNGKSSRNYHLEAALGLAEEGWPVFPLRPRDKRPLTAHGFHDATTEGQQIRRWWEEFPDAGIGVATGKASGLVVLDVDPRNDGDETLRALVAQFGELPATRRVATGGGGWHYYFQHPGGVVPGVQGLYPGIDLKSDGGYVAAPCTLHPDGRRYRFDPVPLPPVVPLPEWLATEIGEAKKRELQRALKPAPKREEGEGEFIYPQGERDNALTSLAGAMQRKGMAQHAILAALLAENEARCRPPLPEDDVARIVRSVGRYEPEDREARKEEGGRRCELVNVQQWMVEAPPAVDWVLEGWLAKGDCALLVGPEASGKSWFSLDLGVAGGVGEAVLGWPKFLGPRRRVFIVDEENPRDLVWQRLRFLADAHGVRQTGQLEDWLFLTRPCQGFSFRDRGMVADLHRKVEVTQPDVIIIDSATAVSNIDNENDAVAVRRLFHDYLYPLREVCGSTVLVLHHANKRVWSKGDETPQGSSAVRGSGDYSAAADAVLFLWPTEEEEDGNRVWRLAAEKVRRGRRPADLRYCIVRAYPTGARPLATAWPEPKRRKR